METAFVQIYDLFMKVNQLNILKIFLKVLNRIQHLLIFWATRIVTDLFFGESFKYYDTSWFEIPKQRTMKFLSESVRCMHKDECHHVEIFFRKACLIIACHKIIECYAALSGKTKGFHLCYLTLIKGCHFPTL